MTLRSKSVNVSFEKIFLRLQIISSSNCSKARLKLTSAASEANFIELKSNLLEAKIVKLSCCFYGKFLSFVGGSTANALGAVFFMYSTSYVLMGLTHEKASS